MYILLGHIKAIKKEVVKIMFFRFSSLSMVVFLIILWIFQEIQSLFCGNKLTYDDFSILLAKGAEPNLEDNGKRRHVLIFVLQTLEVDAAGFLHAIESCTDKPGGNMRKLTDTSKHFATGWRPHVPPDKAVHLPFSGRLSALSRWVLPT
jgi:hypothetical protein